MRSLALGISNSVLKSDGGVHRMHVFKKLKKYGSGFNYADESNIKLNLNDFQLEAKRASESDGKSIYKSESVIRIVHLQTGITVDSRR